MTRFLTVALATLGLSVPGMAEAQEVRGIGLEVRGGFNVPTGSFKDSGAETEMSFGGDVILNVHPALSLYGGWGRSQFGCDGCGGTDDIHSSGPELGVKVIGSRYRGVLPWARLGLTYHQLSGTLASAEFESDRRAGVQASLGADIPLGEVLSIAPAVRFQNWTARFAGPFEMFGVDQNVRYVAFELGAHFHLRSF